MSGRSQTCRGRLIPILHIDYAIRGRKRVSRYLSDQPPERDRLVLFDVNLPKLDGSGSTLGLPLQHNHVRDRSTPSQPAAS